MMSYNMTKMYTNTYIQCDFTSFYKTKCTIYRFVAVIYFVDDVSCVFIKRQLCVCVAYTLTILVFVNLSNEIVNKQLIAFGVCYIWLYRTHLKTKRKASILKSIYGWLHYSRILSCWQIWNDFFRISFGFVFGISKLNNWCRHLLFAL